MEHRSLSGARAITSYERTRIQKEVLDMLGSAEFRLFIRSVVRDEMASLGMDPDRCTGCICT